MSFLKTGAKLVITLELIK